MHAGVDVVQAYIDRVMRKREKSKGKVEIPIEKKRESRGFNRKAKTK